MSDRPVRFDEIGRWSELKLEIVEKYGAAYTRSFKNTTLKKYYIDGFSGSGIHVSRRTRALIEGSPARALKVVPSFDGYYFIDLNPDKTSQLKELCQGKPNVHIHTGDANAYLTEELLPTIHFHSYKRALCLFDPYGLDLGWEVMRLAGKSKAIDMFLNFPVMDMNRNAILRNPDAVPQGGIDRMNRFWGDDSWRTAAYAESRQLGLFGRDIEKQPNDAIVAAFRQRLREHAGFGFVPEPLAMRNSTRAVVYYLFFASPKAGRREDRHRHFPEASVTGHGPESDHPPALIDGFNSRTGMLTDLLRLTAREVVGLLKAGKVSPVELIEASLARIAAVEPAVNALPTLCPKRARECAQRLGPEEAAHPGWLAGLPIAIKDLTEVAGVRTTFGSPIYADHVSPHSDILVENLERHGGVVLAKSNTPEFGAGANTFNEVFGKTRNPWNTALTCGGSSGGAATALATGEIWLATGSDLGGSLRIPASFCSVVGLRPSPGRVARAPTKLPFDLLSVQGPMGRTVGDVALLLDAMSGEDASDPISLPAPAVPFQAAVDRPTVPRRVALSLDLGGLMPVDAEVRAATVAAARRFEALGAAVEEACPDLSGAREVFQVLRAIRFAANLQPILESHRELLKPDVVWNIEAGLKLSGGDVAAAERGRTRIFQSVAAFFATYDLLLTPAVIVPPFDVDQRYVTEVDGHRFETYVDWLIASFAITLTSCPALSLPAGFTQDGRPIGVQLVGRTHGEAALLSAAASLEAALGLAALTPIDPRQRPLDS